MPRIVHAEQIKTQRIAHDADTREAHCRRTEHRVHRDAEEMQVGARRRRHQEHIVDECPEEILQNVPIGRTAQTYRRRDIRETALHQHHIRRVDGHIRARTDCNADVGASQCRRIVDAVADHGDLALFPKRPDHSLLAVRQHARHDLVDTRLLSDRLGRLLVVAGQHDHMDAEPFQLCDCLRAVLLHRIRDRDYAEKLLSRRKVERGLTHRCERICRCLKFRGNRDLAAHKTQVSGKERRSVLHSA